MKMTELQFAGMTISLATLGQVDLSDNDPDMLRTLAYLLEQASQNVAIAIVAQQRSGQDRIEQQNEESRGQRGVSAPRRTRQEMRVFPA